MAGAAWATLKETLGNALELGTEPTAGTKAQVCVRLLCTCSSPTDG